ncbi:hypothetical protein DUNSADRAFT_16604 [Dunaliella salina]|uniref:Uncharacterized protein n=1 Tax=Dunaliella salina TaxID=3046 RepID=A0ABQ7G3A7_DUNSA|nr:hypothetical protein DUNSADRAFT_16604 [Dunaliella salina]|eukprot:KAF5829091.1 hypothetical protein DUNSADRAFT_16604 [Dunaliella salina]
MEVSQVLIMEQLINMSHSGQQIMWAWPPNSNADSRTAATAFATAIRAARAAAAAAAASARGGSAAAAAARA